MTNLKHRSFRPLRVCLFPSIPCADPDNYPEKNLSWFGKLGGNVAGDDSNPILDIDSKPYRDLILANAISLFDFRIYLFACQCAILGRQGRVTDVMSKAQIFIGTFGKILRESEVRGLPSGAISMLIPSQNSFTTFFLESWIYSAALNVTTHCETWATKVQLDGQQLTAFNACKGELLELARNQVRHCCSLGIQSLTKVPI